MKRSKLICLVLLFLTATLLSIFRFSQSKPKMDDKIINLQIKNGDCKTYQWSMITVVSAPGGGSRTTSLTGRIHLRMHKQRDERLIGVKLSDLQVQHEGENDPKMAKVFSQPYLMQVHQNGEFGAGLFSPKLAVEDRKVLDSAVRSFQLVLPENPSNDWETTETDQVGQYHAVYRRETDSNVIVKKKLSYDTLGQEQAFMVNIVSSTVRSTIDSNGFWLKQSQGREVLQIKAEEGSVLAEVDATFTLDPFEESDPNGDAIFDFAELKAHGVEIDAPTSGESAWATREKEAARNRLTASRITIEKLINNLLSVEPNDAKFAHQFVEYLQAFPKQTTQLDEQLTRLNDKQAALLINILQLTATSEAQNLLSSITESEWQSRDNRQRALIAIAGMENPTRETIERLSQLSQNNPYSVNAHDLSSEALLALGSVTSRAPDESGKLVARDFKEELEVSDEPEHQRVLLRACQNGGIKLSRDEIQRFVESDNPGVREAAISLLSEERSDSSKEILLDIARSEETPSVRAVALERIFAYPPTWEVNDMAVRRLTEEQEPIPALRHQLVTYLASQVKMFPQNRIILEERLKHEQDRHVIVAILNGLI